MMLCLLLCGMLCIPLFPVKVERVQEAFPTSTSGLTDADLTGWNASSSFHVPAASAILIDARSRSVLYAQNADVERGMASTTKIMTALVVIEALPPETVVEIRPEMTGIEGSSLYLQVGEHLTVEELLHGLLLESGNDAAVALALTVEDSIASFAERMNRKAKELGLTHTRFANPHGLSEDGHYTTARELALLAAYALEQPLFRTVVSTISKRIPLNDQPNGRILTNHNPMLGRFSGMIGVKTGWTPTDGKCFVSAAERDGLTLLAVSLGDEGISGTHTALLGYGFSTFEAVTLRVDSLPELPLCGGEVAFLPIRAEAELTACLPKGEKAEIRLEVPPFLYAGIRSGEPVGRAVFQWNGIDLGSVLLVSAADAPVKRLSFWEKIFGR